MILVSNQVQSLGFSRLNGVSTCRSCCHDRSTFLINFFLPLETCSLCTISGIVCCLKEALCHITSKIPNRNSPPAILFRRAWREGKRIRRVTLANLTRVPEEIVDGIRAMLKIVVQSVEQIFTIKRSLPHGHVAAVLGMPQTGFCTESAAAIWLWEPLSPDCFLPARSSRPPAVSLPTAAIRVSERFWVWGRLGETRCWGCLTGLWSARIEKSLANRHLEGGCLILYDVTSSYFEGDRCSLAAFGYNRDGKKGKKQIVFGMLCSSQGCPVRLRCFAATRGIRPRLLPR